METIKSKNPCPFCGKKEWTMWFLSSYNEWSQLYIKLIPNTMAFVDFSMKRLENYEAIKNSSFDGRTMYVDECVSCGALVQG